jgi:hypothetical protein
VKGRRILFYDPDHKVRRIAERALLATQSDVDLADDEDDVVTRTDKVKYDLLMVNFDPPIAGDPKWARFFDRLHAASPQTCLVMHATARTENYLPIMAERTYLRNLIAKNDEPLDPDELIVTSSKMLRKDLFGLDKYLMWGVEPYRVDIVESRFKMDYVHQVADYARRLGCNERVVEMVETVVDELVTNAIYNAPRDQVGNAKYAKMSRREPVVLEPHEVGTLEFACDGNHIAVSQSDPFGALTHDTIVSYLNRCLVKGPQQISDASGGAGIGLYRVFQSLSKFIINIEPGVRTEVISLIDLRLSMKQFRQLPKSFHIFVADKPGQAAAPASK